MVKIETVNIYTNIKEGNYYSLLEFHALGDHQTESCLREVVSYVLFKTRAAVFYRV